MNKKLVVAMMHCPVCKKSIFSQCGVVRLARPVNENNPALRHPRLINMGNQVYCVSCGEVVMETEYLLPITSREGIEYA